MTFDPTPEDQMRWRCAVCGAEPGKPCVYVTGAYANAKPGDERPLPHFYRTGPAEPTRGEVADLNSADKGTQGS